VCLIFLIFYIIIVQVHTSVQTGTCNLTIRLNFFYMKKFLAKVLFLMLTFSLFLFYKSSFSYESENFERINDFHNTSSAPTISSSTLSGGTLTINFSAPTIGGTPTSYEFSTTGTLPWTTLSVSGTTPNLVGTVSGLSPTLTEFYIRAVYGSTETLLNTYPKPMTSGWSQILPATNSTKTYKMVVSGTWGIANGRAHRDAAYDAGSNNTIGVSGTPVANRGCDANWLFEGACPPPVPTSPAGYAINNTYEYTIGIGKTAGYSISFSDGGYGDNTGTLTFKLYETTASTNGTPVRGVVSGGAPSAPGMPTINTATLSGTTLTIGFTSPSGATSTTAYQFSSDAGATWNTIMVPNPPSGPTMVGSGTFNISGASPTSIIFRAGNSGTFGTATSPFTVSSGGSPSAPGMPTINTATLSGTTLTIGFTSPSGATSTTAYQFSSDAGATWNTIMVPNPPSGPTMVGSGTFNISGASPTSIIFRAGNGGTFGTATSPFTVSSGGSPSAPGMPTINTATLSGTTLTIGFTSPSGATSTTAYQFSSDAGATWNTIMVPNPPSGPTMFGSGTFNISGASPTSIIFRAGNSGTFGTATSPFTVSSGGSPSAPGMPTINTATLSGTTLTIGFTSPSGATSTTAYQFSSDAGATWNTIMVPNPPSGPTMFGSGTFNISGASPTSIIFRAGNSGTFGTATSPFTVSSGGSPSAPGMPTINTATLSGTTLTIGFTSPSGATSTTTYQFSSDAGATWNTIMVPNPPSGPTMVGSGTFTISGASPTSIIFRAGNGGTFGTATSPFTVSSGGSPSAPGMPTINTATLSGTTLTIGFTSPSGATSTTTYQFSSDAGATWNTIMVPSPPSGPTMFGSGTFNISGASPTSIIFRAGNSGTFGTATSPFTVSSGGSPSAPGMPTINTATLSGTTLTIGFTSPSGATSTTTYQFSSDAGATWNTIMVPNPPSGPTMVGSGTFNISGASPTSIIFRAGNSGTFGTATSPFTVSSGGSPSVPGPPSISTSTLSGTTLTINFAAPTTGGAPTSYEFSATGTTAWTTLSISGTSPYLVGTVTSFSGSVFYIRAVNASGNGASVTGSVSGGSPSIPGVPSLTSATLSGTTLTVNFTAPSSGGTPTGYQYRNAGGSWLSLNVTNLPALNSSGTGTVSGFNGTVNSSIELRALINQDFGSASNSVMISGSGPNAPLAPTINSAILSGTTLTINLTAPNSGVYAYEYKIGASGSWSAVTLMPLPAPNQQADGTVSSFPGIAGSLIYLRGMNADGEGAPSNPVAVKKVISSVTVNSIPNQTYSVTGSAPSLSLVDGNSPMVLGTNFTVAYTNNTNVGTATATITGTGNYTGTRLQTFTIIPKAASTLTIEAIANQTFTGSAIAPSLVVKDGNTSLTLGTDYTVAYTSNTNVGAATATITGIGNYAGTKTQTFTIVAKAASTLTIDPIANQTFTGAALTPAIVVKNGNTTLTLGTDYTVAYTSNTNVGTATATITGAVNFIGTKSQTFTIVAKDASTLTIDAIANQTFTGSAIAPSVVVKDGNTTLSLTTDYTIAYTANTNVGTATVTITGAGNYSGTKTQTFTIVAKAASTLTIDPIANQIFTGAALTPAIVVKDGNNTLTLGSDYSVAYTNNTNAGTATVTITGAGNYTGTKTQTFSIVKLVSSTTIDPIANQTYSGTAIAPSAVVKDGNTTLTLGTDYTVAFTNNTNVGTATVTITGAGNFTGTKSQTFTIVAKDASTLTIDAVTNQTYSGSALTPALVVKDGNTTLSLTTDYTVAYTSNTNVGTATATITGAGNYTGTKTQTFSIVAKAASTLTIDPIANQTFTGAALTPAIVVKNGNTTLTLGTDYSVAYTNNTNAGSATVTITGAGNYTGTKTQTFSIVKLVSSTTIDPIANQTFTGSAIAPSVVVKDGNTTLSLTTDYTVAYTNNTNVGISTVTITGAGNYSGTKTQTFTIVAKAVTTLTIDAIANQTFTGAALTPAIVVKDGNTALSLTTDYTVAYTNNTNTGTATVTITGAGNYTGTKTQTFSIVKLVSSTTIDPIANQTYSGAAIAPSAVVKDGNTTLTLGTDYTLAYTNNTNAGTATVTITGAGNFTGTKSQTFTIVAKNASTLTIDAVTNQTYTGSAMSSIVSGEGWQHDTEPNDRLHGSLYKQYECGHRHGNNYGSG
jgi:hypothetical protein